MKTEQSVALVVTTLMLTILTGCDNFVPDKRVTIANPTCEDLGKITDEKEHKALLAKCPDYLPGGLKRSKDVEW
ncbi:entry exclusion lipoprotein TrbK [Nitrosovibrio sp. Nv4]|uniref:entry exclusion lipoprotein TrbK n=1 Tax=Nitrosovibrio sp. Nv4 TaxID=1945880 RepID=UPI000BDA59EF|nr:entry exclusion lipoprotein TrbK [Nitrosovibrio sp. Nv4]SOD42743.1 entry exclusion lipoprotein TrbK [Nitrosovibrio sp. Nv4]